MPAVRSFVRSFAGAALIVVAFAAATAASAQVLPTFPPTPGGPLTLTGPGVTSYYEPDPVVAVSASGAGVAAWTVSRERADKFVAGEAQLQVSFRAAGAAADAWSAPITISATDRIATSPQVGIDAQGIATIAWSEFTNRRISPGRVRVATASDATLGPIQDLAAPGEPIAGVTLATAPTGEAVLAFASERPGEAPQAPSTTVLAARRSAPTGAFSAPTRVSTDESDARASAPVAAINAAGQVGVLWTEGLAGGDDARATLVEAGSGSGFGAPVEVSAPGVTGVREPALTIDPAGVATVGWSQTDASAPADPMRTSVVVRRVSAGALADLQTLTAADDPAASSASRLRLAGDQAGRITAVWVASTREPFSWSDAVQVATAPAGGAFGPGTTLQGYRTNPDVSLAVDPSGATAVGVGAAGAAMTVLWRGSGSSAFVGIGSVTDRWVAQARVAFGRGPDDLTVLFATDYAPVFSVQTATTVPVLPAAGPAPTPAPNPSLDTTAPTVTIGRVRKALGPKPKKGRKRSSRLTVVLSADEPVQLRASLSRTRPGIRRAGRCVAGPADPKKRKGRTRCVRTAAVGRPVSAAGGPARTTLVLGAAPPAGSYTLAVQATDAAGNRARLATKRFKVK